MNTDKHSAPHSLVQWIESTCDRYRDDVCVTGVGETLTFHEFWARVTSLSSALLEMGVGTGDCVGLLVEQSADQIVGMVAIMAAGAIYVPLDPGYPHVRLSQMVLDANIDFIVSPEHLRSQAESLRATAVAPSGWPSADETVEIRRRLERQDPAYIIFTSGTTGRPKGVVVEHGAVMELLEWMIDDCPVHAGVRIMGTASPNFDASLPNFLLPLVVGGTLVTVSSDAMRDPNLLAAAVKKERPNFLQTSPTMLRMLTEMRWEGDPELEIWTGGERCAASVIQYLVPRVRSFSNYYGPTEATVQVTVARLGVDDIDSPIGRPPAQFGCHVLDENGEMLVGHGEGELYISGPTLARGYLNDPELTSDRFVKLRDARGQDIRAYRTGDVVRYRGDGALVIVGRADAQIKLRGYRIEPGEVEAELMTMPSITDAVVVAAGRDDNDERQLVAFVVAHLTLDPTTLVRYLGDRLPPHMIPHAYHFVDAFPVAPSGKVDRRALADQAVRVLSLASEASSLNSDVVMDEFEAVIHGSFASTLGLPADSFDIDADFFELGGTSLRCARLFMLLEDEFDVTLPLSTLLSTPSVRRLAEVVRRVKGVGTEEEVMTSFKWEQLISSMWMDLLGVPGVNPSDNFYELGGNDELARQFLDRLNGEHGTHVTLSAFSEGPFIAQLGVLVSGEAPRDSLVVLNRSGSQTPFFCIAGAGGLALAFLPLTKAFGMDQPFFGLQARGLESRAIPDYTLRGSARRYAAMIREVQPHGPYVIAGHSLGGVIALQVVQLLQEAGERVALLVIFDSVLSPRMVGSLSHPVDGPVAGDSATVRGIVKMRPKLLNVLRLPFLGIVRQRGVAQFESFYKLGIVQATFSRRLRPWSGRAVVYLSTMDADTIERGWGRLLTGQWTSVRLPGDHNSMLRQPIVNELVADLKVKITAALADTLR